MITTRISGNKGNVTLTERGNYFIHRREGDGMVIIEGENLPKPIVLAGPDKFVSRKHLLLRPAIVVPRHITIIDYSGKTYLRGEQISSKSLGIGEYRLGLSDTTTLNLIVGD